MITNLGTLKSAIADFLMREDLTAVIPTFVSIAHAQINRDLRDWRMEKRSTATFDEGFEDLPPDWIETIRLSVQGLGEVKLISAADMLAKKATRETAGQPRFFAHVAGRIELFPEPTGETGELVYLAKVPAMSADSDTNWLLTDAPDVYLYGSLVHSAPYLKDDARIAVWAGLYSEAIRQMNEASNRARFSGPLRMRA